MTKVVNDTSSLFSEFRQSSLFAFVDANRSIMFWTSVVFGFASLSLSVYFYWGEGSTAFESFYSALFAGMFDVVKVLLAVLTLLLILRLIVNPSFGKLIGILAVVPILVFAFSVSLIAAYGTFADINKTRENKALMESKGYEMATNANERANNAVMQYAQYNDLAAVKSAEKAIAGIQGRLKAAMGAMSRYAHPDCTPKTDSRGQPYKTLADKHCATVTAIRNEMAPHTQVIDGYKTYNAKLKALEHTEGALIKVTNSGGGLVQTNRAVFQDIGRELSVPANNIRVWFRMAMTFLLEFIALLVGAVVGAYTLAYRDMYKQAATVGGVTIDATTLQDDSGGVDPSNQQQRRITENVSKTKRARPRVSLGGGMNNSSPVAAFSEPNPNSVKVCQSFEDVLLVGKISGVVSDRKAVEVGDDIYFLSIGSETKGESAKFYGFVSRPPLNTVGTQQGVVLVSHILYTNGEKTPMGNGFISDYCVAYKVGDYVAIEATKNGPLVYTM